MFAWLSKRFSKILRPWFLKTKSVNNSVKWTFSLLYLLKGSEILISFVVINGVIAKSRTFEVRLRGHYLPNYVIETAPHIFCIYRAYL